MLAMKWGLDETPSPFRGREGFTTTIQQTHTHTKRHCNDYDDDDEDENDGSVLTHQTKPTPPPPRTAETTADDLPRRAKTNQTREATKRGTPTSTHIQPTTPVNPRNLQ